jgi:hypothetical protein
MTAAVYFLMLFLFNFLNAQEEKNEPKRGPMAMSEAERLPPEPRLQSAPGFGVKLENGQWVTLEKREPEAEYHVLRDQWQSALHEGVKDSNGRVVGMPIEAAMKKLVSDNTLKSRAQTTNQQSDYGEEMPTAASSGRVSQKH